MNETKHTPGPWVSSGRRVGIVDRSETQAFGMMLVVAHIDEYDHPEHEANARLIAAAPELLEVLRIAREFMSIASDWNFHEAEINGEMRSTYDWLEVVDAAIAKATGDTE